MAHDPLVQAAFDDLWDSDETHPEGWTDKQLHDRLAALAGAVDARVRADERVKARERVLECPESRDWPGVIAKSVAAAAAGGDDL